MSVFCCQNPYEPYMNPIKGFVYGSFFVVLDVFIWGMRLFDLKVGGHEVSDMVIHFPITIKVDKEKVLHKQENWTHSLP